MLYKHEAAPPWRGFFVLLVLLFCACGSGQKPVYPLLGGERILAFGDSLTAGYGAAEGEDYPSQLALLTGWEVRNAGISGDTTEDGLRRLPAALKVEKPDVVLLCLGGNDLLRKRSVELLQNNLREMLDMIRAAGAQPILVAVPQPALVGLDDHPLYAELAAAEQVPLISGVMSQTLKRSAWRSDRIHPNAAGYQHIAEVMALALGHSGR